MTLPLASLLSYLRSPAARQQNDLSAAQASNFAEHAIDLPRGLSLQWLGTAGFALGHEGYVLLIDPYLTRPSARTVFSRAALRPDRALLARHIPRADAILVGHTHFDHALDIPALARTHGARVYGSRSLVHLMRLHGMADQATCVATGRMYELGPFRVTFIDSVHSKLVLGLKVPSEGELTCDHLDQLRAGCYCCGDVYGIHIEVAGVTLYHQGSADLIEDNIPYRRVDYFLAGIAGRGFSRGYTARALRTLNPRVIVPHHFDNFFLPVDGPSGFSLNVNLGGFLDEVARVSRDFEVRTLTPLQRVEG
jgi:L-ascorbate metabolism protein UlaG (beta-lactamase superfamily)